MTAAAQLNAALAGRYRVEREIGQGGIRGVGMAPAERVIVVDNWFEELRAKAKR